MAESATPAPAPSERPRLPASGDRLLDYQIVRLVGGGGMGRLYEAIDLALDRTVAIKILLPGVSQEFVKRFEREGRILAKIGHPNLVAVHASGMARGLRFLVMEYIVGATPGDLVAKHGPFPPHVATEVALQAARGLGAAHEAGILHRDVKPDNLMASRDGVVKVLDFGIGKDLGSSSILTVKGDVLGTANYMPPEQCEGMQSDERSDVYGLGVTLYHMITGLIPFNDAATLKMFQRVKNDALPVLDRWPGVSPALASAVARMTAKDPAARPQGMREAEKELTMAALSLSSPPSPQDLTAHVRQFVPAPVKPAK